MSADESLDIELDYTSVQRAAERVRAMLLDLRTRFDLAHFEYCRRVRIAPTEIPRSHPQITLNTWVRDEIGLLATYLHEQMHWYVTWYSHAHQPGWSKMLNQLRGRYPTVPVGGADGARDEFSTYLHLIVNWLEVDTTARFIDREQVERHVLALPFYRWCYQTVVAHRQPLAALYEEVGLVPIRHADQMSPADLALAALSDEATP